MARLCFIGCLLISAVAAGQETQLSPRHVSVTGTAVTKVQPDTVVWNVTVRRTNRDLAAAQAASDEGVRKVLALRGDLKLKSEDVQTGFLSVQKIFDRDGAGNITSFRHFEVTRTVTLRQQDTTQFDAVLARLIGAADIEVSYHLESSEYLKLRTQTRLDAVKAAKEKAAAMTELLGAKLGRVLRIAEPRETWSNPYSNVGNNFAFSAPRAAEPDEAPARSLPERSRSA